MNSLSRKNQKTADEIWKISLVAGSDGVLVTSLSEREKQYNDRGSEGISGDRKVNLNNIYSPWGFFSTLTIGNYYQVKRISVNPEQRLSLQLHRHRSEYWTVIYGTARVTIGDHVFLVHEGDSTFIPLLTLHRLENAGTEFLEVIEVQIGEYISEDDIIRYADDYGRLTKEDAEEFFNKKQE